MKKIEGFERTDDGITFIADAVGRRSPRLELTLCFDEEIFRFVDDSGRELMTMVEAIGAARLAEILAGEAETRLAAAEAERNAAEAERNAAEAERIAAEARADALAAKLRALGIDPGD